MIDRRKRRSSKSALLEQCVEALQLVGFHIYKGNPVFKKVTVNQTRYVVQNFPHPSLYGTRGTKEAYLVADDPTGAFTTGDDGKAHIIMEAKWQESAGSVDEKLPYIYECFRASPYPNWIVVFDGRYWKTPRGKAAVAWLAAKTTDIGDRRLYVLDRNEFIKLAKQIWGSTK